MNKIRVKGEGEGYYHIVSRCVMDEFVIDDTAKDMFVDIMRKYEAFCGVEIINYCVMSNHFHLLLRIPAPSVISEDELLERMTLLYGNTATWNNKATVPEIKKRWERLRNEGDLETVQKEQLVYRRRMGDLTSFVQSLKQRFSNLLQSKCKTFTGTIWGERYSSTIVEGSAEILSIISAYIDLNPVRAGLVTDPKEYKWSGYGSASKGDKKSKAGLVHIYDRDGKHIAFKRIEAEYKAKLYVNKGDELTPEEVQEIIDNRGDLPLSAFLRCRVRYFSQGVIVGSQEFIEGVFDKNRDKFGEKRKTASRKLRYCSELQDKLFSARDLQLDPITLSPVQR